MIGICLIPFASAKPISRDPAAVAMLLAGAASQQAQHAAQHADAQSAVDTQLAQAALEENLTHHLPVPPPAMFPLDEVSSATAGSPAAAGSSVFPLSTWHADLPATGLPSLERWTAQGLAPNQRTRIEHIISVYSLGFHQVRLDLRAHRDSVSPRASLRALRTRFWHGLSSAPLLSPCFACSVDPRCSCRHG